MMNGEVWNGDWMMGYGGLWTPVLVVVPIGLVAWIVTRKRKRPDACEYREIAGPLDADPACRTAGTRQPSQHKRWTWEPLHPPDAPRSPG